MALRRRPDICYGLTPQGGARWELYSNPDWSQYISVGYGWEDGEFIGSNRQLLEQYLRWQPYQRVSVVEGSEKWEVLEPCEVTYWKMLPVSYKVSFQIIPMANLPSDTPSEIKEWFNNLRNWYTPLHDN